MTLWLLSVIIVISMICSYIVIIRPPREPALPAPTVASTPLPRASDTPLAPSATPMS